MPPSIKDEIKQKSKQAIIIGAGPAGLTAAYELLTKTDIKPIILEKSSQVGGLAKTINSQGWRFDLGPHRFFSKSPLINKLWEDILPRQGFPTAEDKILERIIKVSEKPGAPDPEKVDRVMLFKNRLTRIIHNQKFFDYPLRLSLPNLKNLGFKKIFKIIISYLFARLFPCRPEISLEDFFINRFGRELYTTFFQSYTEKVWGTKCQDMPKSWGEQRIKGLSVSKVIKEAIKKNLLPGYHSHETSLIDSFLYPKFGAGQMYETLAEIIRQKGGEIKLNSRVTKLTTTEEKIISLESQQTSTGATETYQGDYFFSSSSLQDLIGSWPTAPVEIKKAAAQLQYRDLILVTLVYKQLQKKNQTNLKTKNQLIPDNWLYVQEKNVKIGRLSILNNFSPWLLKESDKVLISAEYFCTQGDELWQMTEENLIALAKQELKIIGLATPDDFITGSLYRQRQAYPVYSAADSDLPKIQKYLNSFANLFLIGRNGLHRYNNMDHSMLTAMTAVNNIITGQKDKTNIWQINTENDYQEIAKS
ncbi:MAG: NAD(P)/FAD-dependent oxidoreductase [Patescibacteria group bacterium]